MASDLAVIESMLTLLAPRFDAVQAIEAAFDERIMQLARMERDND